MHTPQNKQNRQAEEEKQTILAQEIDSWSNYGYALREENRLVFEKMLAECKENEDFVRAANSKDEFFSAESLLMVLILQQQKTIKELITKVSELKKAGLS
jgi:hypothetical protein